MNFLCRKIPVSIRDSWSNLPASCLIAVAIVLVPSTLLAEHRVLLQGNNRLAMIERDGSVGWEMPWGGIHDIHLLENGNILTRNSRHIVVEIDPNTKQVAWEYNARESNGNQGKQVEVHAFLRLPDGNTMIAESGPARIIEVDAEGDLRLQINLQVDSPSTHSDTRLVRRTSDDTYLVAHENDGKVREYQRQTGLVIWEYEVPLFGKSRRPGHGPNAFGNRLFAAIRLRNGNTLIATGNGHSVLEVTPEKEIVWQIHQNDLPEVQLAWVTTLEVIPNGNLVIGNCHAGPDQPVLIEINRETKKVVWRLDRHSDFGNNVSNSLLVDLVGKTIR